MMGKMDGEVLVFYISPEEAEVLMLRYQKV